MRNWIKQQKQNLFLWSPIIIAIGMAWYFAFNYEPNIWVLILLLLIGFLGFITLRKNIFVVFLSCVLFGFGYAGIYSHIKNTYQISHDLHNIEITGTVSALEQTDDKLRIFINTDNFGNVRVSTQNDIDINVGDKISGNGGLFKPSPAYMPENFDFARWAYFNNITATGYINSPKIIDKTASGGINNLRWKIHKTSNSFLTDALILGYQKTLPTWQRTKWMQNGVAHIWSISGYHIGLLSGWLFAIFYLIFRCIPKITKRVPARIPAIICAWIGLVGYVALSGGGVATLRAFTMTTLVMIAFIFGRNVISLRTACVAFLGLVLINPHYVMTAGFQLSFAAIFGLVWLWTVLKPQLPQNKILKYIYAAFLTALTATLFTAPFVIAHFNSVPIYGLIGNLVFLPLFSFIIMPMVIIGTITALVGLSGPLELAHKTYDFIFNMATHITNLPYANVDTGNIPNIAIVLIIIGFGCIMFIKNDNTIKNAVLRHLNTVSGTILCATGMMVYLVSPKPIFYITHDHNLIGWVKNDKLYFNKSKDSGNYFAFDTWKKSNAEPVDTPNRRMDKQHGINIIKTPEWTLVYTQRFVPLQKNINAWCNDPNIKYIASYFDIKTTHCSNKIISGGGVIYESGKMKHTTANRLWHNQH